MSKKNDPSQDLARRLPGLIEAAMKRYLDFTNHPPNNDPKAFAAYSTACRASASHLEQLVKLSRLTSGSEPAPPTPPNTDLDRLIANAESALEKAASDT